jgi:hypothetical protein
MVCTGNNYNVTENTLSKERCVVVPVSIRQLYSTATEENSTEHSNISKIFGTN